MSRKGLLVALAIGICVGLVFAIWPTLDLQITSRFYSADRAVAWLRIPRYDIARNATYVIVGLMVAPAVCAIGLKLICPDRKMLISGRAAVFLIATLLLGPIFTANKVLKDHWGRPRLDWYQGSHTSFGFESTVRDLLTDALGRSGLARVQRH